jgi:hypothetical protein
VRVHSTTLGNATRLAAAAIQDMSLAVGPAAPLGCERPL